MRPHGRRRRDQPLAEDWIAKIGRGFRRSG
jgi:hypothetical protein